MNRDYISHWVIGIICALVWFWGAQVGIPASAISLAAWIVPGLLAHAVGSSSSRANTFTPPDAPTIVPATSTEPAPPTA